MKKFYMIGLVLALVLSSVLISSTIVQADETVQNEKLDKLFKLNRVDKALDDIAEQFLSSFREGSGVSEFGKLEEIAFDAFDADVLYQKIKDDLKANYNEAYVDLLLKELSTEKQMAILDREEYVNTEEGKEEFARFSREYLTDHYASVEKVALAKEMIDVTGMGNVMQEFAISTMDVFLQVMTSADPKAAERVGDVAEYISEYRKNLGPQMLQGILMQTLFTYKDMSDEEFKEYVEFQKGPESRWFNKGFGESFLKHMKESTKVFSEKVIPILQEVVTQQQEQQEQEE